MDPQTQLNTENDQLQEELDDLKEWEDNQYNPGYYIGTGRVPRPLRNLGKYPILLILFGVLNLIPFIVHILRKTKFINMWGSIIMLLISALLIYGGFRRMFIKKK